MKIQLETLPATHIAYVRQTGPYGPGNSKAMEALKEWARAHRLLTGSAILFGIPQDNPDTTLPEHCRYDACISVPENASTAAPAEGSVNYSHLSGGTYAIVTIEHTAEAVQKAWTEILPALYDSGHQLDYQRPVMERYTGDMISNHLCQLCFPVH